jgi:hypothetical protein
MGESEPAHYVQEVAGKRWTYPRERNKSLPAKGPPRRLRVTIELDVSAEILT